MTKKKAATKKQRSTPSAAGPSTAPKKKAERKTKARQKRKPAFEAALDVEAQAAELQQAQAVESDKIKKMPAPESPEFAEPARLPDKTYPGLIPVLKIPFAIWANVKKMPEIRLSDEEADEWGLPVTQLIEYYFPGKIPEIAWVWLMFLSSTGKVIDSRVDMIHEKRQGDERSPKPGPEGPVAKPAPGGPPAHQGSEPAEGYPQE